MTVEQTYEEKLQTLSEGSVRLSFNAFKDVPWDDPAYAVVPDDERWILPSVDPLGGHEWYQGLSRERQIEIGMARMANITKVGWQFENVLIKGVLEYLMDLPNNDPEFRYLMHEVTEETHHIQMFQEFVNRTGADVPGAARWFRVVQSALPLAGRLLPEIFFTGILAGEEPIDHLQKQILRSGETIHPLMERIMQIHVAEEARHISFAHEYLARKAPRLPLPRKVLLSVLYPVIMRLLCDVIATPTRAFIKQYDIPHDVIKDLYWDNPESEKLLRDLFADVRVLAEEAGLMNPVSRVLWKRLRIDGRPARYRSEPAPKAA
ncbi:diiron oxygenase [Nocardioides sp. MH1]|uniref:AurF N-oxygenase family protein n=1 Tax=Nocardioides sp. MH1 TaxID=3242490 RepID=UPI003520569F